MPIEGSLRELAVPDIFQLLHLSRKTGELKVERAGSGDRGLVVFHNGAVVGGHLESRTPHLGQLLLTAGKITEADLRRAEQLRYRNPELSWRQVFDELDAVSPEEAEKQIRFQVEEVVYDILQWDRGRFTFGEREIEESRCVTWLPTESLLMEAARRADERSALPAGIESTSMVPRLSEAAGEGDVLDLAPIDWEVLGRINGESDLKSIAWSLGKSELEVSKTISRLVQQELVVVAAPESERTKPPHETEMEQIARLIDGGEYESARSRIDRLLEGHPSEPRAYYLSARLAERSGRAREAIAAYEKTLSLDPLAEEARLRLGLLRIRLGDVPGGTREWTAYLRVAPDGEERRRVERAMSAAHELLSVLEEFNET